MKLGADIAANSLDDPVVLYEGKVLDGRNRYRACLKAGVQPRFVPYRGKDPLAYVISKNLHRRHLNESQRAMAVAKLAGLRVGDNQHSEGLPIGRGSELLNVGERTAHRAREVLDRGAPELQQAVERGEVSVSAAADVATLPKAEQTEIVARGEREILLAAKEIRGRKAEKRRAERIGRISEISKGNTPLTAEKKYPLILADPPWSYKVYDEESDSDRTAAAQYPCMETADIAALSVPAADDCVLFLWSTAPHLTAALHEHLLIGVRGDVPAPLPACRPPSVIEADRREHSRKPDEAYELIERMYPELPKIELFARNSRPGWDAWGNQAPEVAADPTHLRREPSP